MSVFGIWPQFGFRENPYGNEYLPGDEVGDRLLVGRDRLVDQIQHRIASAGAHPSVEGPAGVGKSSMLAVAGYRMMQETLRAESGQLFVPARAFFQATESHVEFEEEVFREVAQTLINNVEAFRRAGAGVPDVAALNKWLNSAQYRTGQATIAAFGAGTGSVPNETEGFRRSGFPTAVKEELRRCFPGQGAGAIVCVLDNLELLQTIGAARDALEALRDRVFNVQGLRWVLCGSRGIVTHARSQRLSGVFSPPMEVGPLGDGDAIELIRRRLAEFGNDESYAPVPPEAFEFLYRALHSNLRDAMAYAQDFSHWIYSEYIAEGNDLPVSGDRQPLLEAWLTEIADKAQAATRAQPRVWQFFEALCAEGGRAGASEWEKYGFTFQQQQVSAVTDLAAANLVVREPDPENASRSIATVTPQGWLVYFRRNGYQAPTR